MMLCALAVFSGDRCSSRSAFAASTTMVKKNRLRKARANNTIPTPLHNLHNGIHLDGADSIIPSSAQTMMLAACEQKHWDIWRTLSDNMRVSPLNKIRISKQQRVRDPMDVQCTKGLLCRKTLQFNTTTLPTTSLPYDNSASHSINFTDKMPSTTDGTTSARTRSQREKEKEEKERAAADKEAAKAAVLNPGEDKEDAMEEEDIPQDKEDGKDDLSIDVENVWEDGLDNLEEEKTEDPPAPSAAPASQSNTNSPVADTNAAINNMNPNTDQSSNSPKKKKNRTSLFSQMSNKPPTTTPAAATSQVNPTQSAKSTKEKKKRGASEMKEGSKETSQSTSKATPSLKSALKKTPKSKATPKETITPEPKFEKPEHKHMGKIIELSVDFKKPIFEQFNNDRSKAFSYAMSELHRNMLIGDETVWIMHDTHPDRGIGPGGVNVPTNMTLMCNYTLGLSPKIFQSKGTAHPNDEEGDKLDSIGGLSKGKGGNKRNTTIAYFQLRIACNKDPMLLISQVSFEWGKFGTYIRVKDLQALDTQSQYCFYFLYSLVSKSIITEELKVIFKRAQEKMFLDDDEFNVPFEFGEMEVPVFNLRLNVPKIPKANTHKMKVPTRYEGMKKHYHLEVCAEDLQYFKTVIEFAKSKRMFKDTLGSHVHVTECVNFDTIPGDLQRSERFYIKSMNYNASMTASDIDGFLDLDESIEITVKGKVLATLTGRECLLSFYKMDDGSSLFAEVHQVKGSSTAQLVYPNCKEAEASVNAMMKHSAGYTLNVLQDNGVDEDFITVFLSKFFEPPYVHSARDCKWDKNDKILLTAEDVEEDGADLEKQSWYIDIVEKQDDKKGGKSAGYAEKKAMFNLDGENSLKTMHEKNDAAAAAADEEGEEEAEEIIDLRSEHGEDVLQGETNGVDTSGGQQSGHTPESGSVRFSAPREDDDAWSGSYASSGIGANPMETGTASDAGQSRASPETGVSG
eukprot:scaffold14988_cov36-Cyclotella_meneghiniana.AAC.3